MPPFSNYAPGPAAKPAQQPGSATGSHSHMNSVQGDYHRASSEYARQTAPGTPDYDTHRAASHDTTSSGGHHPMDQDLTCESSSL